MSRKGEDNKMVYEIKAATPEEDFLFYSNDKRDQELGCIGHLRGDFGEGKGFWTTWWEHQSELKTQEFREQFDIFVNALRDQGILKDRQSMSIYCHEHPEAKMKDAWHPDLYGFRAKYGKYRFYLRCFPYSGDYNFYIYCYLDERLREAERAGKSPSPKKKKKQPER